MPKSKKQQPTSYAFDRLVQTTLDNLGRAAKRKLGKGKTVASFKLLRYDVALWPDSCELLLAEATSPVIIDLDRGSVSGIPDTVDDDDRLAEGHRGRFPALARDEALAKDLDIVESHALLGGMLDVARAQLVRGVPAALLASGLSVAGDVSGALTDRDSTDTSEEIEAALRSHLPKLAKLAKRHSEKAPDSFKALVELCFADAAARAWLGALATGNADLPSWPGQVAPKPSPASRARVLEAKLAPVSCESAKLIPGTAGAADDDPGSVYGVTFDLEKALAYVANLRRVSPPDADPGRHHYQSRLSIYSMADLKRLALLGQAECAMRDIALGADIRRDQDELRVFDDRYALASCHAFAAATPAKLTFLGERTDATVQRLQESGVADPERVLWSTSRDRAIVLGRGAQMVRLGKKPTPLTTLPVQAAAWVKDEQWVAIAYRRLSHRPDLELYEAASGQKAGRLKLNNVSALFGAGEHLWAIHFAEQETDHYAYSLLDIHLEKQPTVVRRLALPGLRAGSPSDAEEMVRGLFVRDSQALVIWPEEIQVFDLPS
jgi:hypothetical protein